MLSDGRRFLPCGATCGWLVARGSRVSSRVVWILLLCADVGRSVGVRRVNQSGRLPGEVNNTVSAFPSNVGDDMGGSHTRFPHNVVERFASGDGGPGRGPSKCTEYGSTENGGRRLEKQFLGSALRLSTAIIN